MGIIEYSLFTTKNDLIHSINIAGSFLNFTVQIGQSGRFNDFRIGTGPYICYFLTNHISVRNNMYFGYCYLYEKNYFYFNDNFGIGLNLGSKEYAFSCYCYFGFSNTDQCFLGLCAGFRFPSKTLGNFLVNFSRGYNGY